MKLKIKIFISFWILLMSGMSFLCAHTFQGVSPSYAKSVQKHEQIDCFPGIEDIQGPYVKYLSLTPGNGNEKVGVLEGENTEEESASYKEEVKIADYLTSLFQLNAIKYYLHNSKKTLFPDQRISRLSSPRWYIVFRVIRI